jgi:hypothetical protein
MNAKILVASAVLGGATFATTAQAQQAETAPANATATPVPSTSNTPIAAKVEDDSPDHERFVGHFAVGYFGISQIPIANPGAGAATGGGLGGTTGSTVTAPLIGGRYWLKRNLGIDAAIGLGVASGSTTVVTGNTTTSVSNPSQFGFLIHGGVPIAFAEGHHYTFELVPEATLGFSSGTVKAAADAPAGTADISLSGFRLDMGARVGAEIHFGFIGVPELALQASVGLYLQLQSYKASQGNTSYSSSSTSFATSVSSDPWALFTDNISALYYF